MRALLVKFLSHFKAVNPTVAVTPSFTLVGVNGLPLLHFLLPETAKKREPRLALHGLIFYEQGVIILTSSEI